MATGCSSIGPRFDTQTLHGGSQPPETPVPGDAVPSGLLRHQAHVWRTDKYASKGVRYVK